MPHDEMQAVGLRDALSGRRGVTEKRMFGGVCFMLRGHMLCGIGKRGFIDRKANVQIVDWRHAPISQIYYRYDEGDDYDEMIEGRKFQGIVDARRNVSIAALSRAFVSVGLL